MLSDAKLRDLPPLAAEFWKKAQEYVIGKGWVEIVPGTVEFDRWLEYFRWKGWAPFWVRAVRKGQIKTIVMPERIPEHFDLAFTSQDTRREID